MAMNLVDPPGGDIAFPRVLCGQTVPVIEQIIQNQLVHAHRCPSCSEPVCIYVKRHQVHQVTCEVKNCLPCTRYHHWMVMHTSNCAGKCLMKECPQLKEYYRSKKLEEIRSLFPADLMDPVLPEVQDLSVEDYATRRKLIQSFFKHVKDYMCTHGVAYLEKRDWKRIRSLGEGGFGLCFKVEDNQTKLPMALKEDNPNRVGVNEEEAFFAMMVQRQMNVVPHNLVEYFHVQPNPFTSANVMQMFMELMQCTLSDHMCTTGPLSQDNIRFYCFQIFEGVSFLHSKHYIHRDIKPDNLLLNDTHQRLKIADFGFAVFCRNESIHNPPGCFPGTRSYNPPEIYGECISGVFTDIWQSAASTLFMCTVRRPCRHLFAEKEAVHDTFPRIAQMVSHPIPGWVFGDIRVLLQRCLTANYRARLTADEAKALVRDQDLADTSTASQDSTEVKRIDLLVSPFQSRSQKLYFCKHVLANEHQKGVCPYLMPGWIGSFEEPHQDDTLGMLLDRNDPRGKQHTLNWTLEHIKGDFFRCMGTTLSCEEVTLKVLTRQINLQNDDIFHPVGLEDQVYPYTSLIITNTVKQP